MRTGLYKIEKSLDGTWLTFKTTSGRTLTLRLESAIERMFGIPDHHGGLDTGFCGEIFEEWKQEVDPDNSYHSANEKVKHESKTQPESRDLDSLGVGGLAWWRRDLARAIKASSAREDRDSGNGGLDGQAEDRHHS